MRGIRTGHGIISSTYTEIAVLVMRIATGASRGAGTPLRIDILGGVSLLSVVVVDDEDK